MAEYDDRSDKIAVRMSFAAARLAAAARLEAAKAKSEENQWESESGNRKGKCTVIKQIYDVSIDNWRDVTQEDWDKCYAAAASAASRQCQWHDINVDPAPNDVFDVLAKWWDATIDCFLIKRFANCIQVNGVVMWSNPLHTFPNSEPVKLTDCGFRATHWMLTPKAP